MTQNFLTELQEQLKMLVGEPVWGIVPSEGTALSLEIGAKLPRFEKSQNPLLPRDVRSYEGRFTLFVTSPWRLETSSGVVCGSGDDLTPHGDLSNSIMAIAGVNVAAVRVTLPALDLNLEMENGLCLRTFCEVGHFESEDNYSVFVDEWIYTVGAASRIRREARSPRRSPNIRSL